jgi:hypothetical protein
MTKTDPIRLDETENVSNADKTKCNSNKNDLDQCKTTSNSQLRVPWVKRSSSTCVNSDLPMVEESANLEVHTSKVARKTLQLAILGQQHTQAIIILWILHKYLEK